MPVPLRPRPPAGLLGALVRPPAMPRDRAVQLGEALAGWAELVAALEHLVQDATPGAVPFREAPADDGTTGRRGVVAKAQRGLQHPAVVRSMTAVQAGAAVALVLPVRGPHRLVADAVLAASNLLLCRRRSWGTDGSDQVRVLVHVASAVARAGGRNTGVVDAALWFLSAQATLSYAVSGWAKVAGASWRSGEALAGVMGTATYGDPRLWELVRRYPGAARVLGAATLALECLFPLVYAAGGRPARGFVGAAALFHLVNARVMGLNRFLPAFLSLHPSVLYTAGPRTRPGPGGRPQVRDDRPVRLLLGLAVAAAVAAGVDSARRRRALLAPRPQEELLDTRRGNRLAHRETGLTGGAGPLVVLVAGLAGSPEQLEWLRGMLGRWYPVLTYDRAGYGRSRSAGSGDVLDAAVDDLVDLVRARASGRPVVLVGHSLGGYLAWLATARGAPGVRAVVALDPSHPDQFRRSTTQGELAEQIDAFLPSRLRCLRLGMGAMAEDPPWLRWLPGPVHRRLRAQERDPRTWAAAGREWRAMRAAFAAGPPLPRIGVPALVLTPERTAVLHPEQVELHEDMRAAAGPGSAHQVLPDVSHDAMTASRRGAARSCLQVQEFLVRCGLDEARPVAHDAPAPAARSAGGAA